MFRATISTLAVSLVLSCFAACASDDAGTSEGARASLGCVDGSLDLNVTHVDFMHDGATRSYELHLPPGYDGQTPLPVVLSFHGFTSSGPAQQVSTNMDPLADREGFIVAYPNGIENSWNGGACCGQAAEEDLDDVGFTRALIADLGERGCIDERRVYATGMSNGGFLSHRLACEAADVIAAVAPVAGVLGIEPEDCVPSRPIPVIHFHGTADPLVPVEGADSVPSVAESTEGWIERNDCSGEPRVTYEEGLATCETVDRCSDGVSVTLCLAEGAGHCWLGQPCRLPGLGEATTDIDANEVMWELFEAHKLP
jgi:polyhydroxybutyrate depolymerase